jgi:hypothetical protein
MYYTKLIHDKLITDFKALTFESSVNKIFVDVQKYFKDLPTNTPICRIIALNGNIQNDGNSTDTRTFSWQADVFELIEASASQSEADIKINRLENISDIVIAYLEKIPNSLEHAITNIHIVNTIPRNIVYSYELAEIGVAHYLTIIFDTEVLITPQLL